MLKVEGVLEDIQHIGIDINCGSKCVYQILKNIFIMKISLCGNKLCR